MVIGVGLSGPFAKYSELSVCAYCKYSLCVYIITIVSHLLTLLLYIITIVSHLLTLFPIFKVATAHK